MTDPMLIVATVLVVRLAFKLHFKRRKIKPEHNGLCDVDPETLTFKRDVQNGEVVNICGSCASRFPRTVVGYCAAFEEPRK